MVLVLMVGVSTIPPAKAQFVIASWDYPDEYGQGIELVYIHENSTGSWVAVLDPAFVSWNEDSTIEINATPNTAIRLIPVVNINHTLFDFGPDKSENASARAIIRVGIEFVSLGETLFSQDNLTWDGSVFDDTDTTWAIGYTVIINVLLVSGLIYIVTITYEVFY